MFDLADGSGMAFDAKEHVPVFVSKSGSPITAQDWPRFRGALDADLSELNAKADETEKAEERIRKFRDEIEKYLEKADLHPRVRADIFEILERTVPRRNKFNYGPNATKEYREADPGLGRLVDKRRRERAAGATDEEAEVDVDALSKLLQESGLDDDAIEQAVRIATGEEDESEESAVNEAVRNGLQKSGLSDDAVEEIVGRTLKNRREAAADRLPANALKQGSISGGGIGGYGHGSKNGEHEMAHDSARFDEMFPDAARLQSAGRDGNFGYGTSNLRKAQAQEPRRRRTRLALDERRAQASNDYYTRFPGAAQLRPTSM